MKNRTMVQTMERKGTAGDWIKVKVGAGLLMLCLGVCVGDFMLNQALFAVM